MATISSAPSAVQVVGDLGRLEWWLKDPIAPALNAVIETTGPEITQVEDQGVFEALGWRYPVVVRDAMGGEDGNLTIACWTQVAYDALRALRNAQRALLLVSPHDEQWYVALGATWQVRFVYPGSGALRYRQVSVAYREVGRP